MCVCPQHHSHELAGPQLRRGGRKNAALSGGKTILIMELEKNVQCSKVRTARSKTATEASTGHTSPFKPNGEATLQETSPPPRRKCVKFIHSLKSTDAEHASTVVPSIATTKEKSSPEESNFRFQRQHPDTRNNDCQKQGHEEIM